MTSPPHSSWGPCFFASQKSFCLTPLTRKEQEKSSSLPSLGGSFGWLIPTSSSSPAVAVRQRGKTGTSRSERKQRRISIFLNSILIVLFRDDEMRCCWCWRGRWNELGKRKDPSTFSCRKISCKHELHPQSANISGWQLWRVRGCVEGLVCCKSHPPTPIVILWSLNPSFPTRSWDADDGWAFSFENVNWSRSTHRSLLDAYPFFLCWGRFFVLHTWVPFFPLVVCFVSSGSRSIWIFLFKARWIKWHKQEILS